MTGGPGSVSLIANTDSSSLMMSPTDRSSFRRLMTVEEDELGTGHLSQVSDSGLDGEGGSVVVTELVG